MIKEHIDTKELKTLACNILDQIDSIEQYGYVGCYAITEEEVKKISEKSIELIKQSSDYLDELQEKIKDSFEY